MPNDLSQGRAPSPILELKEAQVSFSGGKRLFGRSNSVLAVDGVSFSLDGGEALGLVGESGSGKSTVARLLLRLVRPTKGKVLHRGEDVWEMARGDLRDFRRDVQMVFQDPFGTLNPRRTVFQAIAEPWEIFPDLCPEKDRKTKAVELLQQVGMSREHLDRYPTSFSGGQRQRINIARALAVNPSVIVCDEPTSALDVSIQAQIINLLRDIRSNLGVSLVFISHDLAVVRQLADRIAVMQGGSFVEVGMTDDIFAAPRHSYTRSLLSAIPRMDAHRTERGSPSPSGSAVEHLGT